MALENPTPALLETASTAATADFPEKLRGKKILLATESLGPVNGVSRTTQSLIQVEKPLNAR